jgi:hypothetical protein
LAQLDSPDFYSGTGANAVINFKKAQASLAQMFPNSGFDKYKGQPNQVFTKGIAGAILNNMQQALQGLGQVRIAEIDLLKQAMASPNNTIEANRTLLNMALRVQERMNGITAMAQDYASGAAVVNPFSGKNEVIMPASNGPRAGGNIDPNFDRMVTQITKAYPAFTPDEIKNAKGVWERDKAAPAPPKEGASYPKPSTDFINILKQQGESARPYFEQRFGPGSADKYLKKAQ